MSRLLLRVACVVGASILLAGSAPDKPSPKHPIAKLFEDAGPLKLVTGNAYLPFSDESLPGRGLATEVIEAIFKRADVPYTIEFLPWSRAEKFAESAKYAATFPYVKSPEREEKFLYSEPIFRVTAQFFVRAGTGKHVSKLEDIKGWKLCKPIGYALEGAVQGYLDSGAIKLEAPVDMASCIRMLKAGRVDAITESDFIFWPTLEKTYDGDLGDFEALDFVIQDNRLHFIVSKRHPHAQALIDFFNAGLRELKKSGEFKGLDRSKS